MPSYVSFFLQPSFQSPAANPRIRQQHVTAGFEQRADQWRTVASAVPFNPGVNVGYPAMNPTQIMQGVKVLFREVQEVHCPRMSFP